METPAPEPAEADDPPVLQPVEVIVGCPQCGDPLELVDVDEITVDVCSLHGLWLDLGEEEPLLRRARRSLRPGHVRRLGRARRRGYAKGYLETGLLFTSASSRRLRSRLSANRKARMSAAMAARFEKPDPSAEPILLCPVCGEAMRKHVREDRHGETPDIVVDICPEHGLWLDLGELPVLADRAEDEGRRAAALRVRKFYERGLREGREDRDWEEIW